VPIVATFASPFPPLTGKISEGSTEASSEAVIEVEGENPGGTSSPDHISSSPATKGSLNPAESCFEVSGEIGGQVGQAARHKKLPNVAQVTRDLKGMGAVAKIEINTILDHNKGILQALQEIPFNFWIWSRPGAPHPQPATRQSCNDGGQRVLKVSNLI